MKKYEFKTNIPYNKGGKETALEFMKGIMNKISESYGTTDNFIVIEVRMSLNETGLYDTIHYMIFKNLFEANSKINELMYTNYGVEVYNVSNDKSCSVMYKTFDSMNYSRFAMISVNQLDHESIAGKLCNINKSIVSII